MKINQNKIQEVIQRLVKTYDPLKIYLFGSYAWGKPNKDSDLDIFIVVKNSEEDLYRRTHRGYDALYGLNISKDIIVYTQKEFEEYSKLTSTLSHKIKKEGKLLYESH